MIISKFCNEECQKTWDRVYGKKDNEEDEFPAFPDPDKLRDHLHERVDEKRYRARIDRIKPDRNR